MSPNEEPGSAPLSDDPSREAPAPRPVPTGDPGTGDGGGFFAFTVARPVALLVAFTTLLVLGLISYQRLNVQLLPEGWAEPGINMWIPNSGASAQENEERVARVIEEQLRTLTGIEEIRSWSDDNDVEMSIDFDTQLDLDLMKAEVRDRLERARPNLPDTVDSIGMWSEDADALPITFFGVLLSGDEARRDFLIERVVKPRLEAVNGIGNVELWGVGQDSVRILLDEDKVAAAQLDLGQVIQRLMNDNFAQPLGEVTDGGRELILRSDMRFKSTEEIARYPVKDGLVLADLGEVRKVKSVGQSVTRINGMRAYYGMATKASAANIVETSQNFEAAVEALKNDPKLAGQFDFIPFFLQGDIIESALSQLKETAMWGGLLAVVVLFVFLRRVRLTLCVALSIPVSALIALSFEYFRGGTFNLLTMTGITLGIGMLVDNAVVVVENIARMRAEGHDGKRAAAEGTRQIAMAVTLATLTTVVVFLPLIFMSENPLVRVALGGLGIPLSVSLLASLFVAVVFLPVVAARVLGDQPRWLAWVGARIAPVAALPTRLLAYVLGGLHAGLRGVLHLLHRLNVVGLFGVRLLRYPLALVLVLTAGWFAWNAWGWELPTRDGPAVGDALDEFGIFGAGNPMPEEARGALPFVFIGVVLALLVVTLPLLLWALPRLRRRRLAPLRFSGRLVPRGDSLVEMVIAANQWWVGLVLRHRILASVLAIVCLFAIVPLRPDTAPTDDEQRATNLEFRVSFDGDFTLAEANEEVAVYEDFIEGKRAQYGYENWAERFRERWARYTLYWEEPPSKSEIEAVRADLKENLPRVAGHRVRFYDDDGNNSKSTNAVAAFTLIGPDAAELERLGLEAAKILETVPGLSQVSTPLESAPDQIAVQIDREKAHNMGVTTQAVEQTISYQLRGFSLPRYQEEGRDIPLLIEYDEEQTAGLPTLRDMNVFAEGAMVPLSTFADLAFSKGSRGIFRRNGKVSFTLRAKVDDPLQVVPTTQRGYLALTQLELPRGYEWDLTASAQNREDEEFGELNKGLILSLVLVFLVMGILFESVTLPFSVFTTFPYAILGAFGTLQLTGRYLDPMGFIGLFILAGVVVNNGIVLVDRIHGLRGSMSRSEAVLEGCRQRVRPVLMTALTTFCGLLPMILTEPPENGFDYRTLGTIVAGGLVVSTVFTLWVVPLAYTLIDDLTALLVWGVRWWFARLRRAPRTDVPAPAAELG